jgi:hypothetical protein
MGPGMNAYRYVFASALFATKSNIADEAVASNAPTLQQQDERIICDPSAATGQPQAAISLQLGFVDRAGAPVLIDFDPTLAHVADPGLFSVCSTRRPHHRQPPDYFRLEEFRWRRYG